MSQTQMIKTSELCLKLAAKHKLKMKLHCLIKVDILIQIQSGNLCSEIYYKLFTLKYL